MGVSGKYTYQTYPISERATKLSRAAAILTAWPFTLLCGMLLYLPVALVMISMNLLTDTMNGILLVGCWVIMFFALRKVKTAVDKKIEEIAREDMNRHQQQQTQNSLRFSKFGDLFSSKSGDE